MGLKDEIRSVYIDVNGLVSPHPTDPTKTASDNGPMYTAEYLVMLSKLDQGGDFPAYVAILNCMYDSMELLSRWPSSAQPQILESVDDYYAVLNLCMNYKESSLPRTFLKSVIRYKGALNNVEPGTWTWKSFLVRQPQLLASMVSAAYPSMYNPFHYLLRILALPFYLVAAINILIAGIGAPHGQADPWRLSWHLLQATAPVSLMCWLASKFWYWRLYKAYPDGMKGVAYFYYLPQGGHPFSRWWQD